MWKFVYILLPSKLLLNNSGKCVVFGMEGRVWKNVLSAFIPRIRPEHENRFLARRNDGVRSMRSWSENMYILRIDANISLTQINTHCTFKK